MPQNKNAEGYYEITNAQAHAWVEVYFEGFGWYRFEPTAEEELWAADDEEVEAAVGGGIYESTENDFDMIAELFAEQEEALERAREKARETMRETAGREQTRRIEGPVLALLVTFGFICVAIIGLHVIRKIQKRKWNRLFDEKPDESVALLYKHYNKMLRLMKCVRNENETLSQFARRVEDGLNLQKDCMTSASKVFEKRFFGSEAHHITVEEKTIVVRLYQKLLKAIEKNYPKWLCKVMRDVLVII